MMKSIRPRLVTFDVTGTLLTTKWEKHYMEIGSQYGLSLDRGKLTRTYNNTLRRLTVEHPIYGKHTGLGWENWWRSIIYDVFRDQHNHVPDTTLDKVASSLIRCYSTSMCWHKYPGTIELLEYLRKRNLILGVVSNFDERLEAILEDTGIRFYFSFVLTSYDFGVEKPNTRIFEEALRLTKEQNGIIVTPKEAVHIGDSYDTDYIGAKNADWNAILINQDDDVEHNVSKKEACKTFGELQTHFSQLLDEKKMRRQIKTLVGKI